MSGPRAKDSPTKRLKRAIHLYVQCHEPNVNGRDQPLVKMAQCRRDVERAFSAALHSHVHPAAGRRARFLM